jgi:hypothetical protein
MEGTAVKSRRRPSGRRLSAYGVASLASIALAIAVVVLLFGDAILDGLGKRMIERAYGKTHAGSELRIGTLDYSARANRLIARSVTLTSANTSLKVERITLTGVRWAKLLLRKAAPDVAFAETELDAVNLDVGVPRSRYGIGCARLRASVPDSELTSEGFELRTLAGDDDFYAAREFRMTRYLLTIRECRVQGLAYDEMLRRKSYRARSVHFSRPSFEAMVNRDKPRSPPRDRPFAAPDLLSWVRNPLQIDSLAVTDGTVKYCDRVIAGDSPAVLTFGAVSMAVEGLANRSATSDAILIQAQGALMNAGVLKMQMTIPVASPDFSLHYSGSLGAMDMTSLNAFLDRAVRTRIASGYLQDATFDIQVTAGQASGHVRAHYKDLKISRLDKETGHEGGLTNRVTSFLANVFKIRNDNAPDAAGSIKMVKVGKVDYSMTPGEHFCHFIWCALRTGILDVTCP